jgi:hypothetical protein
MQGIEMTVFCCFCFSFKSPAASAAIAQKPSRTSRDRQRVINPGNRQTCDSNNEVFFSPMEMFLMLSGHQKPKYLARHQLRTFFGWRMERLRPSMESPGHQVTNITRG